MKEAIVAYAVSIFVLVPLVLVWKFIIEAAEKVKEWWQQ